VLYVNDPYDQVKTMAASVAQGATTAGAEVRVMQVAQANYKRDVFTWADGIALGSFVDNGSPEPSMLSFIDSFDFEDDLSSKVGGAFAVAGNAAAGLESTLSSLERGMRTFGVMTITGASWRNREGTGMVVDENTDNTNDLSLALGEGTRLAQIAAKLLNRPLAPGDGIPPPVTGVTAVLNSVALSLGRGLWTDKTRLSSTCESYCRGWTAAVGCGTCKPSAFSFPGGAQMCVHPGPLGTGLLCRVNQTSLEVTGESCCGVGGPCQLPQPSVFDFLDTSTQWPGGCCAGKSSCGGCAGGSPLSDRFPLLNESVTIDLNRRYFDEESNQCKVGIQSTR